MQGQSYPRPGCKRWRCGGDLVRLSCILQHYQPSQLTDYSPKCDTTSYSRNVSIPTYFYFRNRSRPTLASHYEWIQERFKAIKIRYAEGKVSEGLEKNEIRFFKDILISNNLVWTKERIFNDIPIDVLTASALLRGYERISFLCENKSLRQTLTENLIGSGLGLNLQQIQVLEATNCVPGYVIVAWRSNVG